MRKATDQRDAQTISLLWTRLLLFHGGDVTCFDACHVIWCSGHVIWCDVIACVVSCHVMQCDVMWCALMWCALPWPRCVFEVVLWQCGDPKYYSVLQSTTVYYKVLLQYYSVLQSTTPVLLCTTQYYNVLLQYYSVLQSTTPVLLCTAKYYSSTTPYYKVLLQYYSVLQVHQILRPPRKMNLMIDPRQYETSFTMRGARKVIRQLHQMLRLPRKMNLMIEAPRISKVIYNARSKQSQPPTSPNTAPATKSLSSRFQRKLRELLPPIERRFDDHPTTIRAWSRHLAPAASETFLVPPWRRILYRKIQHFALRLSIKISRQVTLQLQQILRLPRKMNLMIDPRHIWNVIYNARSNKRHTTSSPNTAPATQNESHDWSASHMKRHLQCAEQAQSASNLTKYCACHEIYKFKISAEAPWIASANRKTIRRPSDDHPSMKSSSRTRRLGDLPRPTLETHFVWKNTTFRAPAIYQNFTKCCACHEKWHSNFSKYCACHAKWISWLIRVTYETSFTMRGATNVTGQVHQILRLPRKMNLMNDPRHIWNVIYNARSKHSQPPTSPNTAPATKSISSRFQRKLRELLPPIERRFDDHPTTIRAWNRHLAPAASETFLVPPWRRILYGKIQHFALRLSIKISPSAAPATKSDTPTSANTAPATQNESHDWSASHMKRHLQFAEQQTSQDKFTKYCACHAKWISWLIRVT